MMTERIRDELEIQRQSQQTQVVKGSRVVVDKKTSSGFYWWCITK